MNKLLVFLTVILIAAIISFLINMIFEVYFAIKRKNREKFFSKFNQKMIDDFLFQQQRFKDDNTELIVANMLSNKPTLFVYKLNNKIFSKYYDDFKYEISTWKLAHLLQSKYNFYLFDIQPQSEIIIVDIK